MLTVRLLMRFGVGWFNQYASGLWYPCVSAVIFKPLKWITFSRRFTKVWVMCFVGLQLMLHIFHYSRCGILLCCDKGMCQGQGHVITPLCPWHLLLSQYCGYAILSWVALSYKERQMCATLLATIWYSYNQIQCTYWPHTDGRQSSLANLCSVEKWSYWRCFTVEVPKYITAILMLPCHQRKRS